MSSSATVVEPEPHHLPHHAEPSGPGHGARVRDEVTRDDAQQCRLAGTVGSDERDLGALAHAEGHVVEQDPAVGQLVAHSGDLDMTHVAHSPGFAAVPANG